MSFVKNTHNGIKVCSKWNKQNVSKNTRILLLYKNYSLENYSVEVYHLLLTEIVHPLHNNHNARVDIENIAPASSEQVFSHGYEKSETIVKLHRFSNNDSLLRGEERNVSSLVGTVVL